MQMTPQCRQGAADRRYLTRNRLSLRFAVVEIERRAAGAAIVANYEGAFRRVKYKVRP